MSSTDLRVSKNFVCLAKSNCEFEQMTLAHSKIKLLRNKNIFAPDSPEFKNVAMQEQAIDVRIQEVAAQIASYEAWMQSLDKMLQNDIKNEYGTFGSK